jgi:hypothetical protein
MDLLKSMMENRKARGMDGLVLETTTKLTLKDKPKVDEGEFGTKKYRRYIIENKPKKKKVAEHLQAIIDDECVSSSEEEY